MDMHGSKITQKKLNRQAEMIANPQHGKAWSVEDSVLKRRAIIAMSQDRSRSKDFKGVTGRVVDLWGRNLQRQSKLMRLFSIVSESRALSRPLRSRKLSSYTGMNEDEIWFWRLAMAFGISRVTYGCKIPTPFVSELEFSWDLSVLTPKPLDS